MATICPPLFRYIAVWLPKALFCHFFSLYELFDQLRNSEKGDLVRACKLRPVIPFLLLGVTLLVSPFLSSQSQASSFGHGALEMDISDKLCDPLETVKRNNLTIEFHRVLEDQCKTFWKYEGFSVYRNDTKLFDVREDYFSLSSFEKFPANISPGSDITGDGSPNLIVSSFSGGAHCCIKYLIFDVGEYPRHIGTLSTLHSEARFEKIDGIPGVTIHINDWTYAYWNTSFAGSPAPVVKLRFDHETGWFVPAVEQMRSPVPPQETINKWTEKIHGNWNNQPSYLWSYMLELIYAGNLDVALELMNRSWPPEGKLEIPFLDKSFIEHVFYETELHPTSKSEFWHGLLQKLSDSPFAEEIFVMNTEHICGTGPLLSLPYLERYLCRDQERHSLN